MLRKESEAVPEGNGPVPQQVGSGQPTLEDEILEEDRRTLEKMVEGRTDEIEKSAFGQPGV